jgi:hypothetical protein
LAKCSFTLVNSAFASVASLDFGVFRDSLYLYASYYYVFICNLGAMKGLGNITSIPSTGFTVPARTNYSVACEVGHGYVDNPAYDDRTEVVYVRLYVVESIIDTGGGIMGAKVKYQYPFVPEQYCLGIISKSIE